MISSLTPFPRLALAMLLFFSFVGTGDVLHAHEVRPAHLTVTETTIGRYLVQWTVPAATADQRIAIDPEFASNVTSDVDQRDGFSGGASVRSWNITCEDGLAGTDIGFRNLPATMIDVLVQVTFLDGRYYTSIVRPSSPVFHIPERDSEASIFSSYMVLGIEHILFGWDHLLFVLGLTILVTDRRRLFWAVTGFTVAHSITLSLAMLDVVRVPGPPVEAIIALSIVLLAVENIRMRRDGLESLATRSPWLISMVIGLVHGLGFAGALSEYGLPGHAKFVSLFSFNLGVEVGQVGFILVLLLLAALVTRANAKFLPALQTVAASLIGVTGAFWFVERVAGFFS
jgi:hydrogenase/urease accessory protein HupE